MHVQVQAARRIGLFLEAGQVGGVQTLGDRQREHEPFVVMSLESFLIEGQRPAQSSAQAGDAVAGHFVAGLASRLGAGRSGEEEGFALGLSQLAARLVLGLSAGGFELFAQVAHATGEGFVESWSHFLQVKAGIEAGAVVAERYAVAIENAAPHRQHPDGPVRLRFQPRLKIPRRDDLHPPQPHQQNHQAAGQHHRHPAQVRVAFLELVEDEHG